MPEDVWGFLWMGEAKSVAQTCEGNKHVCWNKTEVC